MDDGVLFSLSPEYRFVSPKYDDIEEYCEETIKVQPSKKKGLTKKSSRDSSTVTFSKPKKSRKLVREENKKYSTFMKAVEENNPFKDQVETEEEKKLKEEMFKLPDVSDVELLYEPEFKPVRDIGLKMASQEELEESYNRVHKLLPVDKIDKDKRVGRAESLLTKVSTLMNPNEVSSFNVNTKSNDLTMDSISNKTKKHQKNSSNILEVLKEKKDSVRTKESIIFLNSTNIVKETSEDASKVIEINKETVVEEPEIENIVSSDDDSMLFRIIENKDAFIQNEIHTKLSENKLPVEEKNSRLSYGKHRRKVPVRCVKVIENNHNDDGEYFEQSPRFINKTGDNVSDEEFSISDQNIPLPVKRKSLDDGYPGGSKKQIFEINDNDTMEGSKYFSDKTEDANLSTVTVSNMLKIMGQEKLVSFRKLFPPKIKKIGEGSFGEVYSGINANNESIIYKVTPFDADDKKGTVVNENILKGCREVIIEYMITAELSKLSGMLTYSCDNFVKLYKGIIVKGTYPSVLINAWKTYKKGNEVFNEDPSVYKNMVDHFMILELEDAGIELEKYSNLKRKQAYSIIFQLIHCLRIAEQLFHFEHRDLHESNILIQSVDKNETLDYIYYFAKYKLKSHGVKVKIIDYTLSRMTLKHEKYYSDLEEIPELFNGNFDPDTFQAIYSKMRKLVKNDWSRFCSKNNLLWIIYHAKKLFSLKDIKDQEFLDYFTNDVPKMECLEQLFNDDKFIEFQKSFIV